MFVTEIFESFHGEVNGHHQGRQVTFIRLSGCNMTCPYCDTQKTWNPFKGVDMSPDQILHEVQRLGNKYICLTGGEPLLHKDNVLELLHILWWHHSRKISVETNGTIDITPFFRYVESFVIDYKINIVPRHVKRISTNYMHLRSTDVVKFVVTNPEDAVQAFYLKQEMERENINSNPIYAFSPVTPGMDVQDLKSLMNDHNVRDSVLSIQVHKFFDFK